MCQAIVKSTQKQCSFKAKSDGLCGVHLRAKNVSRVDDVKKIDACVVVEKSIKKNKPVIKENNSHLEKVEQFALKKFKEHGLSQDGWSFGWDKAYKRFGVCRHFDKKITLSRKLVEVNSFDECKDTILHEISHALCGPSKGHGKEWKKMCIKVGARPVRCYDPKNVKTAAAKHTIFCPKCDISQPRYRNIRPKLPMWCRDCMSKNSYKICDEYRLKIKNNETGEIVY